MAGIRELVQRFASALPAEVAAPSENFLLENGVAQLEPFFDAVEVERQPNARVVPEPGPLVGYVRSMWSYRAAVARREEAFADFLAGEIAARGPIRVAKEIGLLTGRRGAWPSAAQSYAVPG